MSDEDAFDAVAAAATATGEAVDDAVDGAGDSVDLEVVDDVDDEEDVVELGSSIGSILSSLVSADERGPTAPTLQSIGLDEGTAHVVDGLLDLILDVVDVELGDTIGPLGKLAVGVSRFSSGGADAGETSAPPAAGDAGDAGEGLSEEAQAVMAGVESAS